jgi:bla regulator protein blaR1
MIAWAIETLVASTLLMLLVLAIRAPVRRAVGPQIAYALWALPLLRMMLPPMPEGWRPTIAPIGAGTEPGTIMMMVPVADIPALPEGWGLAEVPFALVAIWALGAAGFIGWHLIAYSRFCARLRAGARAHVALAGGRVAMIESAAAAGPLAFGIWRKYVAFPADFAERYDEMERDLALAHELGHHARGDLAANWAALAVLALHWFNPVAWRAFRAFRADQEMACDALVLSGRHAALRHAYGRAIVKSAHGGAVSAACHLHTVNEIKGRLRMLTRHQKPSRGTARAGLAGIAALAVTGLALTASGTRAAENLKAKVEDRMGVSIDTIEMPELPPLPALAPPPEEPQDAAPPEPIEPSELLAAPGMADTQVYRSKDGTRTVVIRRDAIDTAAIEADAARVAADAARIRVPRVRSERCGGNGPVTRTVHDANGIVTTTTICTDRIERQVAEAQHGRAEGMRAAALARAEASHHAAAARAEARREAAEALREAAAERAQALRTAELARSEVWREAQRARDEARRDAEAARIEAQAARAEARAYARSVTD